VHLNNQRLLGMAEVGVRSIVFSRALLHVGINHRYFTQIIHVERDVDVDNESCVKSEAILLCDFGSSKAISDTNI